MINVVEQNRRYRRVLSKQETDWMISMFNEGVSDVEVAKRLELRRTRVERIRQDMRIMRAAGGGKSSIGK